MSATCIEGNNTLMGAVSDWFPIFKSFRAFHYLEVFLNNETNEMFVARKEEGCLKVLCKAEEDELIKLWKNLDMEKGKG